MTDPLHAHRRSDNRGEDMGSAAPGWALWLLRHVWVLLLLVAALLLLIQAVPTAMFGGLEEAAGHLVNMAIFSFAAAGLGAVAFWVAAGPLAHWVMPFRRWPHESYTVAMAVRDGLGVLAWALLVAFLATPLG